MLRRHVARLAPAGPQSAAAGRIPVPGKARGRAAEGGVFARGGPGGGDSNPYGFLSIYREWLPKWLQYGWKFQLLRYTLQTGVLAWGGYVAYVMWARDEDQVHRSRQRFVFVKDDNGKVASMTDATLAEATNHARLRADMYRRGEL